jgi:hypothetical protein
MARQMMRILKFFLNKETQDGVAAPAFSITKVMAAVAPLVTALVAVLTSALGEVDFTATQVTVLLVALVGFLAITGAADVLARGWVTSAEKAAASAEKVADKEAASALEVAQVPGARSVTWVRFASPLVGRLGPDGTDEHVKIVAASDAEFLCLHDADAQLSWEPANKVIFN